MARSVQNFSGASFWTHKVSIFSVRFFALLPSQQKYRETQEYIIFFFEAWLTILGKRTLQSFLIPSQGQYTFTQYWLDRTIFCVTYIMYHDSWVMTSNMVVCHIVKKSKLTCQVFILIKKVLCLKKYQTFLFVCSAEDRCTCFQHNGEHWYVFKSLFCFARIEHGYSEKGTRVDIDSTIRLIY